MKNLVAIFLVAALAFVSYEGHAQMTRKEKKEWKKRIKKLTPQQYKTLLDENKSLKGQVNSLKTELSGVDQRVADKDDQISQYQNQIASLRDQLSQARAAAKEAQAQPKQPVRQPGTSINDQEGVVFKVQIGAFANKDLAKYEEASENFSAETSEGGLNQFTLGVFRDYWEADTFKKYLREMGVKDAWIVSYRDGQRVPIKDVLENVSRGS